MVRVAIKRKQFLYRRVFALANFEVYSFAQLCGYYLIQALVLTIGGDPVFHCNPLRLTVYSLWNRRRGASVLRADITRTSRIRFSIAVLSIPCYFIDGRYYPQSVRRTAVLSCDSKVHPTSSFLISPHLNFRAANRVVCWLYLINRAYCSVFYIATTPRYALVAPLRVCGVWVARSHAALWSSRQPQPSMDIIAQILQLFIVVLCPRPKLCTGVSTVEFMYLWIARFHCSFLVLCIYTATTGHLLYLSQYTLFLVRQVPNLHTIVVARVTKLPLNRLLYRKPLGRLNRSLVQCCGSSRNPNSLIAFASLTFRVVIRCAIAGDVLLVMATIASACLVHLLFLRHLV